MKTIINIKADKEVKEDAKKIAKEMGFSLSAIINAYLKQFIRNKEIHFSTVPKMNPELENLLSKTEFDIQRERNLSSPLSNKKDIDKHLNSL